MQIHYILEIEQQNLKTNKINYIWKLRIYMKRDSLIFQLLWNQKSYLRQKLFQLNLCIFLLS